jgi:hypothetical protein
LELDLLGEHSFDGESPSPGCAAIAIVLPGVAWDDVCARADDLANADKATALPTD